MIKESWFNYEFIWKIWSFRKFKRCKRGKYKLIDILIITIYGLLCDLKDFTNIANFMKLKEDYFTELLKLENGTPSHDCFSNAFSAIDSKKLWNRQKK